MKEIIIHPGETKEIYFYVNLKGKLYYKITNQSGTNKLKFWWIKGPFGNVEGLGELIGAGALEYKGFIWGRLKASFADSLTYVQVSENSRIALDFPDINF